MIRYKYYVMVIINHIAKRVIVTEDIATAQKETRIRIGQGLHVYYIRKEVEE